MHARSRTIPFSAVPSAQGLYDPQFESDACGVAFIADLTGRASHAIVAQALTALHNLDHRGAAGAEPSSGDGAGITVQIPDAFLRAVVDFDAAARGRVRRGHRVPAGRRTTAAAGVAHRRSAAAAEEGLKSSAGATCPLSAGDLGPTARSVMPRVPAGVPARRRRRAASSSNASRSSRRKVAEHRARRRPGRALLPVAVAAHAGLQGHAHHRSARRVLPRPHRRALRQRDRARCTAASRRTRSRPGRSRTRTATSRTTARSTRSVATATGWRRAQALLETDLIAGDLARLFPICTPDVSDSASFDEVLELLHLGGRSLPHAVLMMIPEAWENHAVDGRRTRRAFYEFHASLMEPWDGPACVSFTDGTVIGAVLDRNGLRPGRWWRTARRPGRARQRGRRARHRPGDSRRQGPAAAGPDVPRRHRARRDRLRRRGQGRTGRRAPVRRVAARRADPAGRPARARARRLHATSR